MWKLPENGYHNESLNEWFVQDGYPVLVHGVGRYPELIDDEGNSTSDVPHFAITYGSMTTTDSVTGETIIEYQRVAVTAYHGYVNGLGQQKTIWFGDIIDNNLAAAIAEAKKHLDVSALESIPVEHATASARMAEADIYSGPLTRAEYESACDALDVDPLADSECDSYGVKYGDFAYPEYDAETCVSMRLAYLRLRGIESESTDVMAPTESAPEKSGQLWEPCECGAEPVYMPLHLCDECWPKMETAQ